MFAADSERLLESRMTATSQLRNGPAPRETLQYAISGARLQRTLALHSGENFHPSFLEAKAMAREVAEATPAVERLGVARSFCAAMLKTYWQHRCALLGIAWSVSPSPHTEMPLGDTVHEVARALGRAVSATDTLSAGYMLGTVYTTMLPSDVRSSWGSFYTPPPYVERLLDQAAAAGFNWANGSAADPACGGGAFLGPLASRMWRATRYAKSEEVLDDICARLKGFEIDAFAAWISHVILEVTLLPLCVGAQRRMPCVITVGDSLQLDDEDQFDLVAGNPPYSKVTLSPATRLKFERSLYGHANLYGLFTDLAVRLCRRGGVVAFVTPTSFLGGQYFKALRKLLVAEAPPVAIDFISGRDGVFDDVLQETMLAVYVKGGPWGKVVVSTLESRSDGCILATEITNRRIAEHDGPWLIARHASQVLVIERAAAMTARLSDYGYGVSTGPLVWNRHRHQLRDTSDSETLPLIWAESVSAAGFSFRADKRDHAPYFAPDNDQAHLVLRSEAILVQRTTAKEQSRRLICAVIDSAFLIETGGVVVENHLNVIRPLHRDAIRISTIARLLNSEAADHAFRCISGSVAVSAYELNALPLPSRNDMLVLQQLVDREASETIIEKRLLRIYGVE